MPVLISYIWWHHKIFIKDSILVSLDLGNAKYGNCLNLFLIFTEKGIIEPRYKNREAYFLISIPELEHPNKF